MTAGHSAKLLTEMIQVKSSKAKKKLNLTIPNQVQFPDPLSYISSFTSRIKDAASSTRGCISWHGC